MMRERFIMFVVVEGMKCPHVDQFIIFFIFFLSINFKCLDNILLGQKEVV